MNGKIPPLADAIDPLWKRGCGQIPPFFKGGFGGIHGWRADEARS